MTVKISGYVELIDGDTQIDQYDWSASTAISLLPERDFLHISGAQFKFLFAGAGTGAALHPAGTLYFFRADPEITAGDTAITETQVDLIIAKLDIAADDWTTLVTDTLEWASFGAMWFGADAETIKLLKLHTIYVSFYYEGATTINSLAADAESLEVRFIYS